jgi:type III secretion protein R
MQLSSFLDNAANITLFAIMLGLVPMVCVLATSFTKIAIVFGLLKNALGLQQVPSMLVTNALALVITAFIMMPTALLVKRNLEETPPWGVSQGEWLVRGVTAPLADFMKKHVDPLEQARLQKTAKQIWPDEVYRRSGPDDFLILLPAFAISEISAAFKIGFVLYIAFVAIDLIVANVLMAMGMIMFSPTVVSIPLKLILFVAADGWSRLVQALIMTYQTS